MSSSQQPYKNPLTAMDHLATQWHHSRQTTILPLRLAMRVLEIVALAAAMFIVPTFIHQGVKSLDDVYELLGRRARSPYEPAVPWTSVLIAVLVMTGWHVWLGRLSYKTVVEGKGDGVSWGRVLGRIVIPFLLVVFGVQFAHQLFVRVTSPAPLVKENVVRTD
jgi:hypothetical protein